MKKKSTVRPIGRPEIYTFELAKRICKLIAEGLPLTKICKMDGMPDYTTILEWLHEGNPHKEEFSWMYEKARQDQADTLADEIIEIADDARRDNVMAARLRVDARKWAAAKLRPRKYGERAEVIGSGGLSLNSVLPNIVITLVGEENEDK